MSTLSWNYRGLGNRRIVHALEKVVSSEDPNFIFLMKTKLVVAEMDGIKEGLKPKVQWFQVRGRVED